MSVTIPFDRYTFRHWETSRDAWETEAGTWTIHVGRNVEDTPLSATLEVEGTTPSPIDPALGHYLSADVAGITNGEFAASWDGRSRQLTPQMTWSLPTRCPR